MLVELKFLGSGRWVIPNSPPNRSYLITQIGQKNSELFLLFMNSWLALLSDSLCDKEKPLRVVARFVANACLNPKGYILRLASLADQILHSMDSTSESALQGDFLNEMKGTPVFREYLHFYRTGDPSMLQYLLSFLYFGKKLEIEDPSLESSAFSAWMELEDGMANFAIDACTAKWLRRLVHYFLHDLDDGVLLPKHGPGYTSEGYIDPADKFDHASLDAKTRYAFRDQAFGLTRPRPSLEPFRARPDKGKVAKLKFVPKSIKTMRSICMEPITRMYLQQEVARWMRASIESGHLRNVIHLADQTVNQRYASAGSYTYSCDTIDLSSASDSVHLDLVRAVFPSKFLYYMLGTRTGRVQTSVGELVLKKFAPMGSAVCFPTQSILFSAIVTLGALLWRAGKTACSELAEEDWVDFPTLFRNTDPCTVVPGQLLRPVVYGDDIICDSKITDIVLILLSKLGFKVNTDKSFFGGSPIRESCGVYAFNGVDVTPRLFRLPQPRGERDACFVASLVAHANIAMLANLRNLRSAYMQELRERTWWGVPILDLLYKKEKDGPYSELPGLFVREPRYPASSRRYNDELQRDEVSVLVVTADQWGRKVPELYAYDQWMRSRIRGGSTEENFSAPRRRPSSTRLTRAWLPV